MALFWNSNPDAPFWGSASTLFWQQDAISFTYDALARLTQITYLNGTTVVYSYDRMGNRTAVTITCGSDGC